MLAMVRAAIPAFCLRFPHPPRPAETRSRALREAVDAAAGSVIGPLQARVHAAKVRQGEVVAAAGGLQKAAQQTEAATAAAAAAMADLATAVGDLPGDERWEGGVVAHLAACRGALAEVGALAGTL